MVDKESSRKSHDDTSKEAKEQERIIDKNAETLTKEEKNVRQSISSKNPLRVEGRAELEEITANVVENLTNLIIENSNGSTDNDRNSSRKTENPSSNKDDILSARPRDTKDGESRSSGSKGKNDSGFSEVDLETTRAWEKE